MKIDFDGLQAFVCVAELGSFVKAAQQLHLTQTAMWVLIPAALVRSGLALPEHWKVYLPAVLASFVVMGATLFPLERRGYLRAVFLASIGVVLLVQLGLLLVAGTPGIAALAALLRDSGGDAQAPFDRYLFLTTAVGDGYGGLEHRSSTALLCARNDLPWPGMPGLPDGYRTFLGLASHVDRFGRPGRVEAPPAARVGLREALVGVAHGLQVGLFAQAFDQHDLVDQIGHAEHRCKTLELVQQAVGAGQVTGVQSGLDLRQIALQGLLQGAQQSHDPLHVAHVFHGAVDAQAGRGGGGHGACCLKTKGFDFSQADRTCRPEGRSAP